MANPAIKSLGRKTSLSQQPRRLTNDLGDIAVRVPHDGIVHYPVTDDGRDCVVGDVFCGDEGLRDDYPGDIVRR
jgi:hypothetical protein